jgi:hypothetical protein
MRISVGWRQRRGRAFGFRDSLHIIITPLATPITAVPPLPVAHPAMADDDHERRPDSFLNRFWHPTPRPPAFGKGKIIPQASAGFVWSTLRKPFHLIN